MSVSMISTPVEHPLGRLTDTNRGLEKGGSLAPD
jgi:hypothetical protein